MLSTNEVECKLFFRRPFNLYFSTPDKVRLFIIGRININFDTYEY